MKELLRSNPVTMSDWLKFHPYYQPSVDDQYYLKLCNRVLKNCSNQPICNELKWTEYKNLICTLVCYFEDIISGAGIWCAFVREHQKMYGRYLPFYETDSNNYFEDEINLQDIEFLIWHYISILNEDHFFNPFMQKISTFAEAVLDLLETEYETAPQNQQFKDSLIVSSQKDFYGTRRIMEFLTFESYLNRFFAVKCFQTGLEEILEMKIEADHQNMVIYDFQIMQILNGVSPILALRANEQLANMIGKEHPLYHEIKNISRRYSVTCTVCGNNGTHWDLQHVATGKHFHMSNDSVQESLSKLLIESNMKHIRTSIAHWGDEWPLMGMLVVSDSDLESDALEREKHIFDPIAPKLELLMKYEKCFTKLAGGLLAFFQNDKQYVDFLNQFRELLFHQLNHDGEMLPPAPLTVEITDRKDFVAFFNRKAGIELNFLCTPFVKNAHNPHYIAEAPIDVESLIVEKSISADFVKYIIENQLITFVQDKEMDDQTIIKNLDFLLRYFKNTEYYVAPSAKITDSGKNNNFANS